MLTLLMLLALALGLQAPDAAAGEEVSAMRGPAEVVRTSVLVANNFPPEIRWKNALLRKPLLVAGGSLEIAPAGEYAAARPYVRLPEQGEGILAHLMKAISPEQL